MEYQPLTGVVAQALPHVALEVAIATLTPIVLEILSVEAITAKEIILQQGVIGQMLLIAAKVSNSLDRVLQLYLHYFYQCLSGIL